MQIITQLTAFPDILRNGAISIGKFDGMHFGHSQIVERLKFQAQTRQIPAILVTFEPHPAAVLQPDADLRPICTLERKIELIRQENRQRQIDAVVVITPTPEFLQQSAEIFFRETIRNLFRAQVVLSGRDFSFGRGRSGTPDTIRQFGQQAGIDVEIVEPVRVGTGAARRAISSSWIRQLLQEGEIGQANELMPNPYRMTGTVVSGERRGRTLGFPTANFENVQTILPKDGVYATATWIAGKRYGSTTHIGANVTFGVMSARIETFVHDFSGDLYGERISIDFLSYLRGSKRFDSADALIRQMREDVLRSRTFTQ
ncbi:MAG: riboflavin biosynthesis protein RibF [Planctomycetaceae bacterium]|nr:riboflavin biosynthesis protein RibF [Planctomycetaceae bacterium]